MFAEKKWKQSSTFILDFLEDDIDREFGVIEIYEAGLKNIVASLSSARGMLRMLVGYRYLKQRRAKKQKGEGRGGLPNFYRLTATGKAFRERYEEMKEIQLEKAEQLAGELDLNEEQYNLFLLYVTQGILRVGKMPLDSVIV